MIKSIAVVETLLKAPHGPPIARCITPWVTRLKTSRNRWSVWLMAIVQSLRATAVCKGWLRPRSRASKKRVVMHKCLELQPFLMAWPWVQRAWSTRWLAVKWFLTVLKHACKANGWMACWYLAVVTKICPAASWVCCVPTCLLFMCMAAPYFLAATRAKIWTSLVFLRQWANMRLAVWATKTCFKSNAALFQAPAVVAVCTPPIPCLAHSKRWVFRCLTHLLWLTLMMRKWTLPKSLPRSWLKPYAWI